MPLGSTAATPCVAGVTTDAVALHDVTAVPPAGVLPGPGTVPETDDGVDGVRTPMVRAPGVAHVAVDGDVGPNTVGGGGGGGGGGSVVVVGGAVTTGGAVPTGGAVVAGGAVPTGGAVVVGGAMQA